MTDVPSRFVPCTTVQTELGEGARWDAVAGELLTVDIARGVFSVWDVSTRPFLTSRATYDVGHPLGAVAPLASGRGWLLAHRRGLSVLGRDGRLAAALDLVGDGFRVNDAAVGPDGRFWVGTMADDASPGAGLLWRVERDGRAAVVRRGLTIPNGLGWCADGSIMLHADSGPGIIDAIPFDVADGGLGEPVTILRTAGIDSPDGVPDGLTVDAQDTAWVAMFNGHAVLRMSLTGEVLGRWSADAAEMTSVCLGGPSLDTVFATSATENWDDERRRRHPHAGLTFTMPAPSGVRGVPALAFEPLGDAWPAAQ